MAGVSNVLVVILFKPGLSSRSVNALNKCSASIFSCVLTGISAPPSNKTLAVLEATSTFFLKVVRASASKSSGKGLSVSDVTEIGI